MSACGHAKTVSGDATDGVAVAIELRCLMLEVANGRRRSQHRIFQRVGVLSINASQRSTICLQLDLATTHQVAVDAVLNARGRGRATVILERKVSLCALSPPQVSEERVEFAPAFPTSMRRPHRHRLLPHMPA